MCLEYDTMFPRGLRTLAKELTVTTHIMQSPSNKFSTSISDSIKCKQKEVNTFTLNSIASVGSAAGCEVLLSS